MKRSLVIVFLMAAGAVIARPCECGSPMPACAYVAADAIFVGRVSFTNDDRSGTFLQATLVRFDVEEIFKGISAGTKHVWVDPGSFTSCYEKYHLGERYLIVAQRRSHLPSNFAAMTLAPSNANDKAFPPGIDPARPPIIYWAPECSALDRQTVRRTSTWITRCCGLIAPGSHCRARSGACIWIRFEGGPN